MHISLGFPEVLYTTASCKSHLDHGLAHHWIDVSREEVEEQVHRIAVQMYERKREDAETKCLMQEHHIFLISHKELERFKNTPRKVGRLDWGRV